MGQTGLRRSVAREQLKAAIAKMDLKADNRLPPEMELAEQLGIGRPTLRQVLEELEAEGLVIRRKGKGTFVVLPDPRHALSLLGPWDAEAVFARQGYHLSHRLVEERMQTIPWLDGAQRQMRTVSQMLYLDQSLYGVRVTAFPPDLLPDTLVQIWKNSFDPLPVFLSGRKMTVTRLRSQITAVSPLRCPELFGCLGGEPGHGPADQSFLQMDGYFTLEGAHSGHIFWREYSHPRWISYQV